MASSSNPLSIWARNISPSPTLAVDAKAKALAAAGEDVCGFGAGEPDFDTPDFIKQAAVDALAAGKTKYAPTPGIPPLRQALAEKYQATHGIPADPARIVVSPGGKFSCYLAILATCGPGDEVIVPAPYWVSYPEMVKLAGAEPVVIDTDDVSGFKISPEQLQAAITPKTRMVILNSPSNPTGAVYTRSEVERLTEVAVKNGIFIMSDEIYEYLLYDGAEHVSPASLGAEAAAQTIIVAGFSKTFSMTGWRLGAMLAPAKIAKAVIDIQSQTSSNATTFAQYGALAALQETEKAREAVATMLSAFDRRRRRLHAAMNEIPGISCLLAEGAFYLFPNVSGLGLDSTTLAARLLDEEKVAVVPGIAFGSDAHMRLSYATSDEVLEKGAERIAQFAGKLH
ncbi:MAG: aspartate aminotransferase [Verrucomicrobia bacterium]|nr:MAG: aspartate aminotransferase [Verrucomicrobiota bacterium]